MAHLVAHHRLDLRQRAAVEQVVVESDPLGAEKTADVGADSPGLLRRVDLPHLPRLDSIRRAIERIGATTLWSSRRFGLLNNGTISTGPITTLKPMNAIATTVPQIHHVRAASARRRRGQRPRASEDRRDQEAFASSPSQAAKVRFDNPY